MVRKFALVIVAIVSLSAANLVPTSAYAWHGGWRRSVGTVAVVGMAWRRMGSRLAGWLGTGMGVASRLGMGRTTIHRGAGILWRRMLGTTSCPWSVGTSLGSRQQVLVIGSPGAHY